MIRQFRHKGLETFFGTGSKAGIRPEQAKRLKAILAQLHMARSIDDLTLPGLRPHPLKDDREGFFAVSVSGNWRIVFRFEDGDVTDVDYVDYH
jgi:proteic killer suppression protein